jgi:hypothetical protein
VSASGDRRGCRLSGFSLFQQSPTSAKHRTPQLVDDAELLVVTLVSSLARLTDSITVHHSFYCSGVGRGCGVGCGLGVGVGLGVPLGVAVGVAVGVGVGVGVPHGPRTS